MLIAISTITVSVSISTFASLLVIPLVIASSTVGLKMFVTIAWIKKCKSIMKKKRKKHDKIVLLTKYRLNNIQALALKL